MGAAACRRMIQSSGSLGLGESPMVPFSRSLRRWSRKVRLQQAVARALGVAGRLQPGISKFTIQEKVVIGENEWTAVTKDWRRMMELLVSWSNVSRRRKLGRFHHNLLNQNGHQLIWKRSNRVSLGRARQNRTKRAAGFDLSQIHNLNCPECFLRVPAKRKDKRVT